MRIEDTRIFMGGLLTQQNAGMEQTNKGVLNFFNRNASQPDKVEQKRQEAQQKAMNLVKDVFTAEKSIDDDLKERAAKVEEAESTILAAQKELNAIEDGKAQLKQTYGITDDCQEQKDLELLEKRRDMFAGSGEKLTEEEWERLAEIDKQGKTEYQRMSLEMDASGAPYRETIKESKKVAMEENIIIREIGLARLKSSPMVEASNQAEEVMKAANKEIIGMIMEDGKDTADEKIEEVKEEQDKVEEEQEQKEEQIEEIQRKSEEMEEAVAQRREENKDGVELPEIPMDRLLELDSIKTEVKQEVNNMLNEMKVLTEELKGSVVDTDI